MKTNDSLEVPTFWGWFEHFVADIKSAAFRSGLELAVWGKIADGHCTAEAIAAREGWDANGVRRLLNVLVSIGLLTIQTDEYVLVPEAEWYLVPGKSTYMGNFLLHLMNWEGDHQLANAIRTGQRPIVKDIMQDDLDAKFGEFLANDRAAPGRNLEGAASMWQGLGIKARPGSIGRLTSPGLMPHPLLFLSFLTPQQRHQPDLTTPPFDKCVCWRNHF